MVVGILKEWFQKSLFFEMVVGILKESFQICILLKWLLGFLRGLVSKSFLLYNRRERSARLTCPIKSLTPAVAPSFSPKLPLKFGFGLEWFAGAF